MKDVLRKELKQKRAKLTNKEQLSDVIAESFLSTDLYKNSDVILLYYSVGSEVATHKIFSAALKDEKRIAFPVCLNKDGAMEFHYICDHTDLEEAMYGIKAPKSGCMRFENCQNALCIVPGLAFDNKGYRIGYGKGYYDRFLETFDGISVGLCFEAMLKDALPINIFDETVDYLITDKKIYKFNDKEDLKNG